MVPAKIAPVEALVINTKFHEYDFRSHKKNLGELYCGGDKDFLLEHAPQIILRTNENNKAKLHPGRMIKYTSRSVKKTTTSEKKVVHSDYRSRRGTPLIAVIRSLATVLDSAFDPVSGNLRREWLHEARPQLFHPDGSMQEYVKTKKRPNGMDDCFFAWLKGEANQDNIFSKKQVEGIVRRVEHEMKM